MGAGVDVTLHLRVSLRTFIVNIAGVVKDGIYFTRTLPDPLPSLVMVEFINLLLLCLLSLNPIMFFVLCCFDELQRTTTDIARQLAEADLALGQGGLEPRLSLFGL